MSLCTTFSQDILWHSASQNGVTLKSEFGVVQDHWKWRRSIDDIPHSRLSKIEKTLTRQKVWVPANAEADNRMLDCRREIARCFESMNISPSHPRSLKVIWNDALHYGVCKSLLVFYWNYIFHTVSDTFSVKEWRDLKIWVWGRSRSLKMTPFDRPYTTFYYSAIVSVSLALSCSVSEIKRDIGRKLRFFIHHLFESH